MSSVSGVTRGAPRAWIQFVNGRMHEMFLTPAFKKAGVATPAPKVSAPSIQDPSFNVSAYIAYEVKQNFAPQYRVYNAGGGVIQDADSPRHLSVLA